MTVGGFRGECPRGNFRVSPDRQRHDHRTLQSARSRAALAEGLGRGKDLRDEERRPAAEILCAGDVSVSVRPHPHGACAQLCDGRRRGTLHACPRQQRPAPDGLGCLWSAGRERRQGAQGSSWRMDLRQHRDDEGAAEVDGPLARLVPGVCDLRRRILPPAAEPFSRFPRKGARLSPAVQGELGPGRRDRARQRAGDRRARLEIGRPCRAARPDAMVFPHHRFQPGSARRPRHARPMAGEGARHAAQLDWPIGRAAHAVGARGGRRPGRRARTGSLHHPAGHDLWRILHGNRARPSAGSPRG